MKDADFTVNDDNMEYEKEKTELIDELKKKIVGDENEGSTIDFTCFIFLFMTILFQFHEFFTFRREWG